MKKILIIGGGPAGLTAAYELARKGGVEVTVFEREEQLGGISRTLEYNGNRIDIGGHRFFSKSETVMNWWREMMPLQGAPSCDDVELTREVPLAENGPNPEKEDRAMLVRSRLSRILFLRKFFDYWTEKNENGKKMRFEKDKVFDIKRRLATWASRDKEYKFKTKGYGDARNDTSSSDYVSTERIVAAGFAMAEAGL